MQYSTVTPELKHQALVTRLSQVEGLHYSNEVYLLEAYALNDVGRITQLRVEQDTLEVMIDALTKEKLNLEQGVEKTDGERAEGGDE